MNRAIALLLIFLIGNCFLYAQKNVILIMADDAGIECFDAYGNSEYETPNFDSLSANGAIFQKAYSQPLCTPSRNQIMTGKYNNRNYVEWGTLDPDEKTFGNYFRENGYKTCIAGKWQLDKESVEIDPATANGSGFDEHFLWQYAGVKNNRYLSPTFTENDVVNDFPSEYGPDKILDFAKDFISANDTNSFFLYYPMNLPHRPFLSTPASTNYTTDDTDYYLDCGATDENDNIYCFGDSTNFADMIFYMDFIVGEIADHLDSLNLSDSTLLIFTTDNGTESPSEDGEIITNFNGEAIAGGKATTTDLGIHVPMFAYQPGTIDSGTVIENVVDFTDILPSILNASNIAIDNCEKTKLDGISFWEQLIGNTGTPRQVSFSYYNNRGNSNTDYLEAIFSFDDTYKYYSRRDTAAFEGFYNKIEDSLEVNNLLNTELSCTELARKNRLKSFLEYYMLFTEDTLSCDFTFCDAIDNNLIGLPCDDGNELTENDIYMPNCNCEGIPIAEEYCNDICSQEGFIQTINTQFSIFNPSANTKTNFGDAFDFKPNAIGFNAADGLIYGTLANNQSSTDSNGNNIDDSDIISIDPINGIVNLVFDDNISKKVYAGDVENETLYFNDRNHNSFYKYDIANSTLTELIDSIPDVDDTFAWSAGDLIVLNQIAYGIIVKDDSLVYLYKSDVSGNTSFTTEKLLVTHTYNFPLLNGNNGFGSAFLTGDNRMFFDQNQGGLYELINYDSEVPTLVYTTSSFLNGGGNDGTSCKDFIINDINNNKCLDIAEQGFIQSINTQFSIFNPSANAKTNFGNAFDFKPNAIGFNAADGLIYGTLANNQSSTDSNGNNIDDSDIISIDPINGIVNLVFDDNISKKVYAGDVENETLYFNDRNHNSFYKYDIANSTLTELIDSIPDVDDSLAWSAGDLIVLNEIAYGIIVKDDSLVYLYKSDVSGNTSFTTEKLLVTNTYNFPLLNGNNGFGSAFLTGDNRMFFDQNQGGLYELQNYESTNPTLVYTTSSFLNGGGNDGTSCKEFVFAKCTTLVTSIFGSGFGSLRDAINCASANDTITFHPNLQNVVIETETPSIKIDKTLYFKTNENQNVSISNKEINNTEVLFSISDQMHILGLNLIGKSDDSMILKVEQGGLLNLQFGTFENIDIRF